MSKTALVTGASSGIGRAIARRLAQDGFTVVVHYNANSAGAQTTLEEVLKFSPSSRLVQFDIADSAAAEKALADIDIDVLINNAGMHADGMAALMGDDVFENVVRTNLFGTFFVSRICGKKMLMKRQGCIVNVSSLAGQIGNPGQINYAAAKAGIISMTKTMCAEFGPRGIRVNAVAPGLIETEMIKGIPRIEELKKSIPLGRFGAADEVAGVVSFLCSKDASYVNGHTMSVNGGLFPS